MEEQRPHIKGIAARAGRWSATHRKAAILGWLAFVVVALAIGSGVGTKQLGEADATPGEAGKAAHMLEDAGLSPAEETVLVQSETLSADSPRFEAAVADVVDRVSRIGAVKNVRSPLDGGAPVSEDGRSALVQFDVAGDPETAGDKVAPTLRATEAAQAAHPGMRIEQFGEASIVRALEQRFAEDLQKAETLSLPITLLILVLAFGAIVAAGVPLMLGISAVAATIGLVAIPSQALPVDESIASVILLIGLAVGVDYSLFYLQRMREERAAGRTTAEAVETAAATSGRAVLISGLTVMTAMAGMLLTGASVFASFGVGTIIVVAVAMGASLTVLPAVLASLGDRVERGRMPFVGGLRRSGGGSRVWAAIADRVMRRPVLAMVLAGGVLLALTIPAFGMKTEVSGPQSVPKDVPGVAAYYDIQRAFPGENTAAVVAVEAQDTRSGAVAGAIDRLRTAAQADQSTIGAVEVDRSSDGATAEITVPIVGDGDEEASKEALASIREKLIPSAFAGVSADVAVTGPTAESVDFAALLSSRMPIVFAFVLGLAFLLMLVTFRSIVIPIKTIVLNLLSVGAAYGVLVLVFQDGVGESLLGFESTGAIAPWLPLFLFVVLFGLSMDYHVFILSRVREAVDRGMKTEDAVRYGLTSTGSVVTSAAVVMVAVFAIFGTLSFIEMKQMGVGLAVAVLLDATLVRAVLLPAAMKLLGEWNWYLPRHLRWLPRIGGETAVEPATA